MIATTPLTTDPSLPPKRRILGLGRKLSAGAFTLIELLVVIAIIAILAGLIFSVSKRMQIAAAKSESISNLRQISAGLFSYATDNNFSLPPATESGGAPGSSWDLKIGERLGESESPKKNGSGVFASRAHIHKVEPSFAPWTAKRSYSLVQYYDASGNSASTGDLTDMTKPIPLSRIENLASKAAVVECFLPVNTRGVHVASHVSFATIFGEWGGPQTFRAFDKGIHIVFCDGHVQFFKQDDLKDYSKFGHWKMFSLTQPPY